MVLRLALYLVEKRYFASVEFVFLIVGHTKNPCDRMFNLLKLSYRKSNVYTMDQTMEKLNENDRTSATRFVDHLNWDRFLDRLYTRFEPGTTKKYHNFLVKADQKGRTTMRIGVSNFEEDNNHFKEKMFSKKGLSDDERKEILLESPDPINAPGIPEIKIIELGTKWRVHVPPMYQDITCPRPSDEVLSKFKSEKNSKRQKKQELLDTENQGAHSRNNRDSSSDVGNDGAGNNEVDQQSGMQQPFNQQLWLAQQAQQGYNFFHPYSYRFS